MRRRRQPAFESLTQGPFFALDAILFPVGRCCLEGVPVKEIAVRKDFLHVDDWSTSEILEALDLAIEVKRKLKNREPYQPFKHHSLAMVFAKPSARTRASFETGFCRLGGHALYLGPADVDVGNREPARDVARVLSGYNDMIMARLFDHDHLLELARYASVPVINGLTDYNHPCQIMADVLTIKEHRGRLDDLKSPSWATATISCTAGCTCPRGCKCTLSVPARPTTRRTQETFDLARRTGLSKVEISHDPMKRRQGCGCGLHRCVGFHGQKTRLEERKRHFKVTP
jgi:ornithine carbamoyltransferase